MACEMDVRVQNECAVRCSIVSKPAYVLEYVKTISSLVGASHILAVFEESDYIKVFFDDKRCVDTLIRSCLHVMGRHINVDYVIPPGVKLILSNVDPVFTNYDVMRLLSPYGTVVSPVIRPPISDDVELCHISYGVRYVYMVLNGCIPDKIDFKYGDNFSSFKVSLVENSNTVMVPLIKTDTLEENEDVIESNSTAQSRESVRRPSDADTLLIQETVDPVLVSVQSVQAIDAQEQLESLDSQTPSTKAVSKESLSSGENAPLIIVRKKRRGRPPLLKNKRLGAVSQAARRIRYAKRKWLRGYKKTKCGHRALAKSRFRKIPIPSNSSMDMPDLVKWNEQNHSNENPCMVLSHDDLLKFIEDVKGHRAPLELARKFIGRNCDSDKIFKLIEQLKTFKKNQVNINLKSRIWRLNKTLTDALLAENNQN